MATGTCKLCVVITKFTNVGYALNHTVRGYPQNCTPSGNHCYNASCLLTKAHADLQCRHDYVRREGITHRYTYNATQCHVRSNRIIQIHVQYSELDLRIYLQIEPVIYNFTYKFIKILLTNCGWLSTNLLTNFKQILTNGERLSTNLLTNLKWYIERGPTKESTHISSETTSKL